MTMPRRILCVRRKANRLVDVHFQNVELTAARGTIATIRRSMSQIFSAPFSIKILNPSCSSCTRLIMLAVSLGMW
jgi:hypothetical protein